MRNNFSYSRAPRRAQNSFSGQRSLGNGRNKRRGAYINPAKFVNAPVQAQTEATFVPKHTFADFGLAKSVLHNVATHGYTVPTPVQDEAILPVMQGQDLIGLANTGTGKTAAFLLPIIHKLYAAQGNGLALIVAPTRELAVQIDQEFRAFAAGMRLYSGLCVGGASLHRQISTLARRPQVIIGTPGRLRDLCERGSLHLSTTNVVVLDEADRMLDMGFIRDIRFLIEQLPASRQSLCFSATLNPEIDALLRTFLTNPVTVSVRTSETSDHVAQDVITADSKEQKLEILHGLLKQSDFAKVLVFGETKHGVQRLAENLIGKGILAEAIHGNKSQGQRQRALQAFKDNRVQVLVATDVAARGLDIPNVTHVVNFDQPYTYEDYIHRIGRTGRAGKHGQALTFVPSY